MFSSSHWRRLPFTGTELNSFKIPIDNNAHFKNKLGCTKVKFNLFWSKTYKECKSHQDALCKEKRKKNRRLTAKFAHGSHTFLNRLWPNFACGVGWSIWSLMPSLFRNRLRGFGVTRPPPKRHFLQAYLTPIALTKVSALPCCTLMSFESQYATSY